MIMASNSIERLPLFLDRRGQQLFAIAYFPRGSEAAKPAVVFFAPFAEEMNRARRMVTLLGEALAARGIGLVSFDYYGTGDSAGDFSETRWDFWIDDGIAAIQWASDRFGGPIAVLGLRLGAGPALAAVEGCPDCIRHIILWQPVASGAVFLNQFLRLRVAADLARASQKVTSAGLRNLLTSGRTLEVAGYALTPEMAAAIDGFRLIDCKPTKPVDWMELGAETYDLPPASRNVVDSWRSAGTHVRETLLTGEAFWAVQETTVVRSLVDRTVSRLIDAPQ